ncbi:MAG: trypsin-like peptidase domain-containing protein [Candidatus Methanoperedens sp.]
MNALRSILEKVKESTMLICIEGKPVGSGLAISRYGIIITCNHVIGEETNLEVKNGKTILSAKVYKRSPENDIAILKAENGLPFLDSLLEPVTIENVEEVYVVGYPIFDRPSITKGIVSAIDRDSEGIIKKIQISAQINKGNSGGPVVSAESGRVIGIVTTKYSEGIGFCIPINAIFSVISRYEIDPLLFNWDNYIEAVLKEHHDGSDFKHFIALECSNYKCDAKNLMEHVTEVWLPDESKSVLAILGEFGSGKTIFCHKLAYILAQRIKKKEEAVRIPILINLGNYSEYNDIQQLLIENLRRKYELPIEAYYQFEILLRSGKLLLILDGFDEMTMRANKAKMFDNFREIMSLITENAKIIITSRTHYFRSTSEEKKILMRRREPEYFNSLLKEKLDEEQTDIVYLKDFSDQDIRNYLHSKLGEGWKDTYAKINSPEFYNLIDLAKRPIFLDVIVKTVPDPSVVIKEQKVTGTKLYDLYTIKCLENESQNRKLNPEETIKLAENLGFQMYVSNFPYIECTETSIKVGERFVLKEPNLSELFRRCALFKRAGNEQFTFIHKSFLEFFVAKKIIRDILDHNHSSYITEYLTPEINRYLFELLELEGQTSIITDWLQRHPDVNVRMNCASTLAYSGNSVFINILEKSMETEQDIGAAGRISEALANLGVPNAVEDFLKNFEKYAQYEKETGKDEAHKLLYDIVDPIKITDKEVVEILINNLRHSNPRIRKYSTFMLGRIEDKRSVPGLIERLKDKKEPIRTRRYAVAALGLIGELNAKSALEEIALNESNEFLRQEGKKAIERIIDAENGHIRKN